MKSINNYILLIVLLTGYSLIAKDMIITNHTNMRFFVAKYYRLNDVYTLTNIGDLQPQDYIRIYQSTDNLILGVYDLSSVKFYKFIVSNCDFTKLDVFCTITEDSRNYILTNVHDYSEISRISKKSSTTLPLKLDLDLRPIFDTSLKDTQNKKSNFSFTTLLSKHSKLIAGVGALFITAYTIKKLKDKRDK